MSNGFSIVTPMSEPDSARTLRRFLSQAVADDLLTRRQAADILHSRRVFRSLVGAIPVGYQGYVAATVDPLLGLAFADDIVGIESEMANLNPAGRLGYFQFWWADPAKTFEDSPHNVGSIGGS